jgi:hypothetical protein
MVCRWREGHLQRLAVGEVEKPAVVNGLLFASVDAVAAHVGFNGGVFLEQVAALGAGCGAHALSLFVPEKGGFSSFPDSREGGEISGIVPESLPPFRGARSAQSFLLLKSMAWRSCGASAQSFLGTVHWHFCAPETLAVTGFSFFIDRAAHPHVPAQSFPRHSPLSFVPIMPPPLARRFRPLLARVSAQQR